MKMTVRFGKNDEGTEVVVCGRDISCEKSSIWTVNVEEIE